MAAVRRSVISTGLGDPMVATLFGMPLTHAEAHAYMDLTAGIGSERQQHLFRAWMVKMALIHGLWVEEEFRAVVEAHLGDVSQT